MKVAPENPLVSVFMLSYNHEAYVAESIESVLAQDYRNIEINIVDDASIDRTPEIIREYELKYPNLIRVKFNPKNLGITPSCNIALSMCTGKYVAFASGDDVWLPGKLMRQVTVMEADPGCVFSYHDVEVFNSRDNRTIRYSNSGKFGAWPYEGKCIAVAKSLVAEGNRFVVAVSVMVPRNRIPSWGFDPRIHIASDWLMWIDILASGPGTVKFIPDVLARYRRHEHNISNRNYVDDPIDAFITLAIVEGRYPLLTSSVMESRSYFYYDRSIRRIRKGEVRKGLQLLFWGLFQSAFSLKWILWGLFRYVPNRYFMSDRTIFRSSDHP